MNEQKSKSLDLMKIALAAGKGSVLKSDSKKNTTNKTKNESKEPKKIMKIEYISKLVNNLRKLDQENFELLKNNYVTELSFDKYICQAVQEKLERDLKKLYE